MNKEDVKKTAQELDIEKLDYRLTYSWIHNKGISNATLKLFKKIIKQQQEEIEKRLEEIKGLYIMMSARDDEIEDLKTITRTYESYKCGNKDDQIMIASKQWFDNGYFEENYISKDKIKEKIEKIKEDEEFYRERDRMYEFNGKINMLKELLGE